MKVPYWQLSGFYGLYFALLGCIVPFWGLYLQQQAFSAEDIGVLLALFSAVRIFAPSTWAVITDYLQQWLQPIYVLRLAGLLMLMCFCGFYWAKEFWQFAVLMIAYGFFWSAILPQYEVLTLNYTQDNMSAYSSIRLWGSIGFIALVSILGWVFDDLSIQYLPFFMLCLMVLIIINSVLLPTKNPWLVAMESASPAINNSDDLNLLPSQKTLSLGLLSFLAINVLLQISHGPYYVFFSIYLQQLGYSSWAIGLLWSLGVLSEIAIFWKIAFFVQRWTLRQLVILALFVTALRWLLTAFFAQYEGVLIFSQCLHAFSFGLLHAVSVKYIALFFPNARQVHGQALYSGLGFGLGGAMGAYLAGIAWSQYGSTWVFVSAAGIAMLAALIAFYGLPRENKLS